MKKFLNFALFAFFLSCSLAFAETKELTLKMVANMKYGKTNDDVKFLQQTLYDFGYYKNEEDEPKFSGKFDSELKNAVLDFQKTNEIKVTGVINLETYIMLKRFLGFKSEQEQEEINKNPYFDDNESNTVNQYKSDIVDMYKSKDDSQSYYENIIGIPTIKKVINSVYPLINKKVDQQQVQQTKQSKFDIFACLEDPACGLSDI